MFWYVAIPYAIALIAAGCANYRPDQTSDLAESDQEEQGTATSTSGDFKSDTGQMPEEKGDTELDPDGQPAIRHTPTVWDAVSGGNLISGNNHRCHVTIGGSPTASTSGTEHRAVVGIGSFVGP